MSQNSKIEWTDHTFNPWSGCTKVSPGCDHCYAEAMMDTRLHQVQWGPGAQRRRTSVANWRKPLQWNRSHAEFFAQHGRRQRVFCASLADVFDNAVDPGWRLDLLQLIADTPNLDWLLLTKRIGNAHAMQRRDFVKASHGPGCRQSVRYTASRQEGRWPPPRRGEASRFSTNDWGGRP
nr:DUF5131 family protein [Cupriavidus laharis]